MYDLISIGNISVDFFFQGDSLTFKDGRFQLAVGGKYFVDKFQMAIGGGGANVAIGASKHGLKTALFGKVGNNPFKKLILDSFYEFGVSTDLLQIEDNLFNISAILIPPTGEKTIIHYATHHEHVALSPNIKKRLIQTKTVYFGNMPDVPLGERTEIIQLLKRNSILTVTNLGVTDCRRPLTQIEHFLKYVDILILNGHEFSELVKAPYKDIHFKENVVDWYIPSLSDKIVIITEGEKGSFSYDKGKVHYQEAVDVTKIVDTTGAGDAYTASFVSSYHRKKNLEESMEKASHYAAKKLSRIGAN